MRSEKERQNSFGKSCVIWPLKIKITSHLNQRSEGERRCSGTNLTAPCSVPQFPLPCFRPWFCAVSCARNKTHLPSGSLTFASTRSPQVDGPRTRGFFIIYLFVCLFSVPGRSHYFPAVPPSRLAPRPGLAQAASSRPRQPASPRPGRAGRNGAGARAGAGPEAAAGCRCPTPFPRPSRRGRGSRRGAARSPRRKPHGARQPPPSPQPRPAPAP